MKEQLQLLMSLEPQTVKDKTVLKKLGIEENEYNNQMLVNIALMQRALKGDVAAFNAIRDTMGEKPVDKVEMTEIDMKWSKE